MVVEKLQARNKDFFHYVIPTIKVYALRDNALARETIFAASLCGTLWKAVENTVGIGKRR